MTKDLRNVLDKTLDIIEKKLIEKVKNKYQDEINIAEKRAGIVEVVEEIASIKENLKELESSLRLTREEMSEEDLDYAEREILNAFGVYYWNDPISKFGRAAIQTVQDSIEFENLNSFKLLKRDALTQFELQDGNKARREMIQKLRDKSWAELGVVLYKDCETSKIENGKLIL